MKKFLKIKFILLSVIISIPVLLYIRYLSLDTYTWDTNNNILILGEKQYKAELVSNSVDLKLKNRIGKIKGEDFSFMVWSIKGENINDRVAVHGFMFPASTFSRIK